MSKLNLRVVVSVLIGLVLIIAIFTSVQAKLGGADANNARSSIFGSLNDQALVSGRENMNARAGMSTQYQSVSPDSGHECGSFADPNADD